MALPGQQPSRSALSQHGAARRAPAPLCPQPTWRCPPTSARCPHQTGRLPFTFHCARPLRASRRLQRLQPALRKDGGSDCGRLNSREAAKSAHKGGWSRGSRAADPWIRCRGRTRRCRWRSRAGTGQLRAGDALRQRGCVCGAGPAGRGRARGNEPRALCPQRSPPPPSPASAGSSCRTSPAGTPGPARPPDKVRLHPRTSIPAPVLLAGLQTCGINLKLKTKRNK